ncbi:hypothetical protein CGZ80_00720 [Rhodopirellula sp. MGV]|nr:hypothetical protein CGZ80_18600 [Rhodopirellula sp. MGV]OYP39199.1 hypothetical protein CGZ80_00720 [Rhodopirellula sp. MGV]PNY35423.1 hypothetical protein C2E31_18115 [Rhodopirellula baltica]
MVGLRDGDFEAQFANELINLQVAIFLLKRVCRPNSLQTPATESPNHPCQPRQFGGWTLGSRLRLGKELFLKSRRSAATISLA